MPLTWDLGSFCWRKEPQIHTNEAEVKEDDFKCFLLFDGGSFSCFFFFLSICSPRLFTLFSSITVAPSSELTNILESVRHYI